MRYIRWIVTVPLGLVVILFAVSNRETVRLELDPLPFTVSSPLYLLVLVVALAGFVSGGLVAWISGRRWRRRARREAHRAQLLERENADLRRHPEGAPGGREVVAPPNG